MKRTIHHQARSTNINKSRALPPIQHSFLSHRTLTLSFLHPSLQPELTEQRYPRFAWLKLWPKALPSTWLLGQCQKQSEGGLLPLHTGHLLHSGWEVALLGALVSAYPKLPASFGLPLRRAMREALLAGLLHCSSKQGAGYLFFFSSTQSRKQTALTRKALTSHLL